MAIEDVAQARVALKFDPLQASAERRLAGNTAHTAATRTGLENWGTTGEQGINTTYNNVDDYLGQNRTASGNLLHGQIADINQVVNGAYNVVDANRTQSRNFLDKYMQLGGLQGGEAQQIMSPVLAALDRNANSSLTSGANLQGAMSNWANQFDQSQGKWAEIAKLTRAGKIGDFKTAVANAIAENNLQGQKNENDLNATLTDLLGQRGNALTDEVDRLTEEAWRHQLEQAKLDQASAFHGDDQSLGYARLAFDKDKQGTADWMNLMQMGQGRQDAATTHDLDTDKLIASEFAAMPQDQWSTPDPNVSLATLNSLRIAHGRPPFANWGQASASTGITPPAGGGGGNGQVGANGSTPVPPDLQGIQPGQNGNPSDNYNDNNWGLKKAFDPRPILTSPWHAIQDVNTLGNRLDKHFPSWAQFPSWMKWGSGQ